MSYYINISKNRTTPIAVDRQSSGSLDNQGFGGRLDAPTEEDKAELSDYMYLYHDDAGLPAFMQIYRHKLLKRIHQVEQREQEVMEVVVLEIKVERSFHLHIIGTTHQ